MRFLVLAPLLMACNAIAADYTATMTGPTDIYGHRVLGSIVEHTGLSVSTPAGVLEYSLPEGYVFEDIAPRLHDLDADGVPEIIIARSKLDAGAALAVYGISDGQILLRAQTPEIGTANRWLAIAGAGDLDGDGLANDIAYVETPHLGRVLRIWRFDGDALVNLGNASGHTNHFIGDEFILGGIRNCDMGDEVVTIDPQTKLAKLSRLVNGAIVTRSLDRDATRALGCP